MTAPNNLDLEGNFLASPFAELLVEIATVRLDGSLRLSREDQKIVVYFNAGELVFAVSNARSARLFDILLRENRIDKNLLSEIPNHTDDIRFAKFLIENNFFDKQQIDALFVRQIEEILRDALRWEIGDWTFSPQVRIKQGIRFQVGLSEILIEYARELSDDTIFRRFRSSKEIFQAKEKLNLDINLQSHEAFVLSRFGNSQLTIDQVNAYGGLPTTVTFQTLYTLWLGGFLTRHGWNSIFTAHRLEAISEARLALKKEKVQTAAVPQFENLPTPSAPQIVEIKKETAPVAEVISLEVYLERVETSRNFYESLAVETKAPIEEIKKSYFSLAKQFHPDRFYRESDTEILRRIQNAFGAIAKAYDTLRNEDSRSLYDFKIRKELAQIQSSQNAGGGENEKSRQTAIAAENFEEGFRLLMDENYADATLFLARAVHLAPDIARYHAYYGKVLAADEKQRYKAESELQTAIRLDPKNATFRIILAEFFIENNLLKRAEGELVRFLAMFPNNQEAQSLLDSLHKKRLN